MVRSVRYTVSVTSRTLLEEFRRECERRGHTQAYVIGSAMRYFVDHPYSRGWGSKGGETAKEQKRRVCVS